MPRTFFRSVERSFIVLAFFACAVIFLPSTLQAQGISSCPSLKRTLSWGMTGDDVRAVQQFLQSQSLFTSAPITGYFGPLTREAVEAFQIQKGIVQTGGVGLGVVGPLTRGAMAQACIGESVSGNSTSSTVSILSELLVRPLSQGLEGSDVRALQQFLKEKGFYFYPQITGYFGPITEMAVKAFQSAHGIPPLGIVGPQTSATLREMSRIISRTSAPQAVKRFINIYGDSDTTGPTISSISSGTPSDTSATIIWSTDEDADSQVEYGTTVSYGLTSTLASTLVTSHSVSLSGLTASTLYHYRARSADGSSNISYSDDQTFTTSAVPDTTAPVVSSISTTTTETTVTVTWTTDEAASSRVDYGATVSYGTASTSATLVTSHSVTITGLTAGTTYYFRVQSADANSNTVNSSDHTVQTAFPLRVSGNLTRGNYAADTTTSGNEHRQTRAPSYLGATTTELWLVYTNWWLDLGAGGKETNTGNAVTLGAALEYNGTTVVAPNAGTGASAYTLADGETFLAGPFYPSSFGLTTFPKGAQVFARTDMSVTVGQKVPRTGQYLSESPASRLTSAAGSSQLSGTGVLSGANNQNGPAPVMLIGRATGPTVAIIEVGDSLGEGQADTSQYPNATNAGGYFQRGAWNASKTAFSLLGRHGGSLSRINNGSDGVKRLALMQYATDVFIAFGANDLFYSTSQNAYTIFQNNLASFIEDVREQGVQRIMVSLVAPRTQSNNSFTDLAGQSPQGTSAGVAGYWDPAAVDGVNDFIVDLKTDDVIEDYFDVNAYWGDGGGNAAWVTTGVAWYPIPSPGDGAGGLGGSYVNGTHPTPALMNLAGQGMTTKIQALSPL